MSDPSYDTRARWRPEKPARRWPGWLAWRWPTALGVALAVLTVGDAGDVMTAFAGVGEILPLLPLLYLIVAKLGRRGATWPVILVLSVLVVVLKRQDLVAPPVAICALAVVVLVWGAMDGQLRRPGMFSVQAVGMVGFGALALVGLAVDPDVGRYLVAAGWFLHGIWDFVHLRLDRVVSRSYAECCGVLDILIAVSLVLPT